MYPLGPKPNGLVIIIPITVNGYKLGVYPIFRHRPIYCVVCCFSGCVASSFHNLCMSVLKYVASMILTSCNSMRFLFLMIHLLNFRQNLHFQRCFTCFFPASFVDLSRLSPGEYSNPTECISLAECVAMVGADHITGKENSFAVKTVASWLGFKAVVWIWTLIFWL